MTKSYKPNRGQVKLREVLMDDTKTRVLCYAGARAGKTFEFVRSIVVRALHAPKSRHAIIRKHFSIAKKYIWLDTLPEVIDLCFPKLKGQIEINKSDYFYRLPNGSEIWIGGLDDKDRADKILGGEYNTMFFNECSEKSWHAVSTALTRLAKKSERLNGQDLINKAYFDTNPPSKSHWSYKLFFGAIDPETRIQINDGHKYQAVHISPDDNVDNLSDDFLETLKNLTGAKRKRFYEGAYQDEIQGALWTEAIINKSRDPERKEFDRIAVAIDPATTTSENSDETGIIVVGKKGNDFYVIDDLSGYYSPNGWAGKAISLYKRHRADRVIGEANNGGDMIEAIIRNLDKDIPYSKVWASRGKITRAEPVAALYEQGRVHHMKELVDLEYEMTNYTGTTSEDSPNRMDALVWAITYLMDKDKQTDPDKLKNIFF